MSMNFLDAAGVLADSAELLADDMMAREAKSIVQATVDAYDALAPDWADAPEWAQWFAIDPNGDGFWFHDEPKANEWRWTNGDWFRDVGYEKGRRVNIPLGVDWRLCKWQRPEVTA